ncbi:hypothetical protein J2853_006764 [Streptosporangium lutulentum]|uniref:HNH endonuclease n=1 Tax=Streptosporangium lutulentum TaxID=1461250 RepID=A0ABT9QLB5_9ACTN|nr:hypothetical protein [Streptosporangium lutulentum]
MPRNPNNSKPCSYPNCGRPKHSRQLCVGHSSMIRRREDLRPLGRPKVTKVDANGMVHCPECQQRLSADSFRQNLASKPGGFATYCTPCVAKRNEARRLSRKAAQ